MKNKWLHARVEYMSDIDCAPSETAKLCLYRRRSDPNIAASNGNPEYDPVLEIELTNAQMTALLDRNVSFTGLPR